MKQFQNILFHIALIFALALTGCGGGGDSHDDGNGSGNEVSPPVTLSIAPQTATIQTGEMLTLTTTVSQGEITWPAAIQDATLAVDPDNRRAVFSSDTAGDYVVTVTSEDDPTVTATATLNVTPPPSVPVTVEIVPQNASVQAGSTLTLNATVNQGSVSWQPVTNAALAPNGNSAAFSANTPGTYVVIAKSTVDASKSASTTITVTAAPPIITSVSLVPENSSIQAGETLTLTASVDSGGVDWQPVPGAALTPNGNNAVFASNTPGTYTVTVVSALDSSKTANATVTVTAPPVVSSITLTPQNSSIQTGETITFNATVNAGSVTWQTSGGTLMPSADPLSAAFTSATPGNYTIAVTATADTSKTATAEITVSQAPPPVAVWINLAPQSANIETGESLTLNATVSTGSVTWQTSGGTLMPSGNSAAFIASTAGTYIVTATAVADTSKTASTTISVIASPPPVTVSITPTTASITAGETVTLTAATSQGGIVWPATIANATLTPNNNGLSATFTSNVPGIYDVTIASDTNPSKTATATVRVTAGCVSVQPDQAELMSVAQEVAAMFDYYDAISSSFPNDVVGASEIGGQCGDYALAFVNKWNAKHPGEACLVVQQQSLPDFPDGIYEVIGKDDSSDLSFMENLTGGLSGFYFTWNGIKGLWHPQLGGYEIKLVKLWHVTSHFGLSNWENNGPHVWVRVGNVGVDPNFADDKWRSVVGVDTP